MLKLGVDGEVLNASPFTVLKFSTARCKCEVKMRNVKNHLGIFMVWTNILLFLNR